MRAYEVDGPLTVGEYYLVPTVLRELTSLKEHRFAIMDDHIGDISGERHYHFDTRFIHDDIFPHIEDFKDKHEIIASCVYENDVISEMSLKCYRNWNSDFQPLNLDNFHKLEDMFEGEKVKCGICPHQGMNLNQVSPVIIEDKLCKICPNHKIAWSIEDGSIIRRKR
jgi:hypothetical protein